MAAILVGFFGVVIAVNLTMARYATATFGGIVVENSYVASQEFNRWLDDAEAQRALGWEAAIARRPDNAVAVALTGVPDGAKVTATARHPLGRLPDRAITFALEGGEYVSTAPLPHGRWMLRLEVAAAGRTWRQENELR